VVDPAHGWPHVVMAIRRKPDRNAIFCNAPAVPTARQTQRHGEENPAHRIDPAIQSRQRILERLIGSIRRQRADHLIVFNA
jgi:hypothetical protein